MNELMNAEIRKFNGVSEDKRTAQRVLNVTVIGQCLIVHNNELVVWIYSIYLPKNTVALIYVQ
ncbi:unnamed protein product, partial [Ceratitis capitata]